MQDVLRIGDRVARRDIPAISGRVIGMRDGQAQIEWSIHMSQWLDVNRLIQASNGNQRCNERRARI